MTMSNRLCLYTCSVVIILILGYINGCSESSKRSNDSRANENKEKDGSGDNESSEEDGSSDSIECQMNVDCESSPVAERLNTLRCSHAELFCMKNKCKVECPDRCEVVRSDVNPCDNGSICSTHTQDRNCSDCPEFCTMLPIPCEGPDDCPRFIPKLPDGSTDEWKCVTNICEHDGFESPTK